MNKLTAEKCREQFEYWIKLFGQPNLARANGGANYADGDVDMAWIAWKASRDSLEIALPALEQKSEITKPIECPFPCGWKELLRLAMSDGAFLARDLIEGGEVKDFHRHAVLSNTERLVSVISAILKTQPQPSTTPQIDNDGWVEWKGGDCPVHFGKRVHVKFSSGDEDIGRAEFFVWETVKNSYGVIAYRVIENDGREG